MTDWWTVPYPGGPMVAVPGFPRPLYPPDAAANGKTPSVRGPDVEAYKRTIVRAGRWPGPLSDLDRQFSNEFAHGYGGNVVETGVAGVQRQQGIDATGWIGKATFNTLRSIKIPAGLPNAGQMAMDANAANLIALAWQMFGGSEPVPPPKQSIREKALQGACKWIGTMENPPGSNMTTFGQWYGVNGQPWCAIFCSYCFEVEAGGSPSFAKGSYYAYVPYIVGDARNQRNGLNVTSTPIAGDLVCYDWDWDGTYDHVGIFEAWKQGSSSTFSAVEGNTSGSSNSNGGEVMRRERSLGQQALVFVRVAE